MILVLSGWFKGVRAQGGIEWNDPVILSSEEVDNPSKPKLAVDPWGEVHVFYAGWLGGEAPADRVQNVILYTYGQDTTWAEPLDVFVGDDPGMGDVAYSPLTDRLYVLWHDLRGLYLSSALRERAAIVKDWQTQTLFVGNTSWPSLAISPDGAFHIVFTSNFENIYYLTSEDYGESWADPVLLAKAPAASRAYAATRLAVDGYGNLHLGWQENAEEVNWVPIAVWYMRSTDGGKTWEEPLEVERAPLGKHKSGEINIGFGEDQEVFLVWNWGAGSTDGRYFRRSLDSGATWSEPKLMFEGYSGLAGWSFPVLDSAGTLHLIATGGTSIHYSLWQGTDWMHSIELMDGEFPDVYLSNGNMIHIVCSHHQGGEVAYIKGKIDAPRIASTPRLAPTSTPSSISSAGTQIAPVSSPVLTRRPTPLASSLREETPSSPGALFHPAVWGGITAFSIVLLVFLMKMGE
jgi:hypothetical protein